MTAHELEIAKRAARKLLPPTLEEVRPRKPKPKGLPPGIYQRGPSFRTMVNGKMKTFATVAEAVAAKQL